MTTEPSMSELPDRTEVVRILLQYFKLERYLYISLILICVVILLISGFVALTQSRFDQSIVVGLVGPSGAITVLTGRLLKMWNDAVKIILKD